VISIYVHNQCSDFELVSPVYFGHNVIWHIPPDQKVDIHTETEASFGRNIIEYEFASALIYKLQRKCLESNDQSNADNTFAEDTSLQLLIMWGPDDKSKITLRALLIKHSNTITWDESKLKKLYSMHLNLLRNNHVVRDTWLLDDVIVLKTMLRQKNNGYITEVAISEETKEDDSIEPLWVPSNI
jgi:hypothetical protein